MFKWDQAELEKQKGDFEELFGGSSDDDQIDAGEPSTPDAENPPDDVIHFTDAETVDDDDSDDDSFVRLALERQYGPPPMPPPGPPHGPGGGPGGARPFIRDSRAFHFENCVFHDCFTTSCGYI